MNVVHLLISCSAYVPSYESRFAIDKVIARINQQLAFCATLYMYSLYVNNSDKSKNVILTDATPSPMRGPRLVVLHTLCQYSTLRYLGYLVASASHDAL